VQNNAHPVYTVARMVKAVLTPIGCKVAVITHSEEKFLLIFDPTCSVYAAQLQTAAHIRDLFRQFNLDPDLYVGKPEDAPNVHGFVLPGNLVEQNLITFRGRNRHPVLKTPEATYEVQNGSGKFKTQPSPWAGMLTTA